MHPPERDSSGLTVVDEALEIVHLRAAGAWPGYLTDFLAADADLLAVTRRTPSSRFDSAER